MNQRVQHIRKTIEKLRKRVDVRRIIIAKDYQKVVVKPIFSKNNLILIAVHKIKEPLMLNKLQSIS